MLDEPAGFKALNNQLKSQEAMALRSLVEATEFDPELAGGGSLLARAPYIEESRASNLAFGIDISGSTLFRPCSRKASITFQTSKRTRPVLCCSSLNLAAKRYDENRISSTQAEDKLVEIWPPRSSSVSTSLLEVKSFSLLAIILAVEGSLSNAGFLEPEGEGVVVELEAPEDVEAIVCLFVSLTNKVDIEVAAGG